MVLATGLPELGACSWGLRERDAESLRLGCVLSDAGVSKHFVRL
jgi:hypothetical protein